VSSARAYIVFGAVVGQGVTRSGIVTVAPAIVLGAATLATTGDLKHFKV
jgi:hypothetical protein